MVRGSSFPFHQAPSNASIAFFSTGAELTGYAEDRSYSADVTMIDGNLAALSKERFSVALGNSLAQQLGVGVGDQVDAVLPQLSVTP